MKVNHGPCVVCGKPILYLGCRYCGPECNFSVLRAPGETEPEEPVAEEPEPGPTSEERPSAEDEWLDVAVRKRLYL